MQWLWDWIKRHDQQHAKLERKLLEVQEAGLVRDASLLGQQRALEQFDQELAAVQAELRTVLGHDEAQHDRG
jgi:hypothetical protein